MFHHRLIPVLLVLIFISCDLFKTQDSEDLPLTETRWELISFHYLFQSPILVKNSEFTIVFSDTGTVQSKVDCNWCSGEFTLSAQNAISIQLGICTEAYCGDDSKDNDFHDAITNITRYVIDENTLKLFFGYNFLYFVNKSD